MLGLSDYFARHFKAQARTLLEVNQYVAIRDERHLADFAEHATAHEVFPPPAWRWFHNEAAVVLLVDRDRDHV